MRRIVVAADSSFVVETIRMALRAAPDLKVVGKVDGHSPARHAIRRCRPEIVLVDEIASSGAALERIRECREEAPGAVVLLLTLRMDDATVRRALAAGADACLSKSAHLRGLATLIREVVNRNVVSALRSGSPAEQLTLDGKEQLTGREREILTLVADGLTNARIAQQLWVTEQTVKFHLSNTYRKLGVANRTQASRYVNMPGLAKRIRPELVSRPVADAQ